MAEPGAPPNDPGPFDDEMDEVFSRANPNPQRIGCPPRETLIALARKEKGLGDPAYEHLTQCSPCYLEFRDIQRELRQP
jgi:hypothetical protein